MSKVQDGSSERKRSEANHPSFKNSVEHWQFNFLIIAELNRVATCPVTDGLYMGIVGNYNSSNIGICSYMDFN